MSQATRYSYLPVSPLNTQWGLYVTGVGYSNVSPGSHYPYPGHPDLYHFTWEKGRVLPEFQVIYLIRGSGVFESAPTNPTNIVAGDVVSRAFHRVQGISAIAFRGEHRCHRYATQNGKGPSQSDMRECL